MVKSPAAVPVKSALVEVDGKDSRKDASEISQVFEEQTSKSQGIWKKTSKNKECFVPFSFKLQVSGPCQHCYHDTLRFSSCWSTSFDQQPSVKPSSFPTTICLAAAMSCLGEQNRQCLQKKSVMLTAFHFFLWGDVWLLRTNASATIMMVGCMDGSVLKLSQQLSHAQPHALYVFVIQHDFSLHLHRKLIHFNRVLHGSFHCPSRNWYSRPFHCPYLSLRGLHGRFLEEVGSWPGVRLVKSNNSPFTYRKYS